MLQWEHSAILLTFIKLPFVIKIFVLSIFEWLFYTGFSIYLLWFCVVLRPKIKMFCFGYVSNCLGLVARQTFFVKTFLYGKKYKLL